MTHAFESASSAGTRPLPRESGCGPGATSASDDDRERLRLALAASGLGVWDWDMASGRVHWSPELHRIIGVSEAEFSGSRAAFDRLVHPQDRPVLEAALARAAATGTDFECEFRVVRPAGDVRWLSSRGSYVRDAAGTPRRMVGVCSDVTERRQADERLNAVLSSIDDHLVCYDHLWRYTFVNEGAARTLGMTREQLLGRCIWELFPQAVGNQYYRELHQAAREQKVIRSEHYYAPFDRWFENHIYPSAEGVTVFAADITARKRAETVVREADRRKDEFLAMLAHELRNPLGPIRNAAQALSLAGSPDPVVSEARGVIDRQVTHMARLVDDLLDVSRISRGKIHLRRERCDLGAIARQTTDDHRALAATAGLDLSLDLPSRPLWVDGDPTRLAQVVSNLLHNAIKFTDRGGRVVVRAGLAAGNGAVVAAVEDTGCGIDPAVIPGLFQPFTQASQDLDRSRGGLGLGLALVKGLLELHGGGVEVRSAGPGHGTTVEFRLPAASGPAGAESAAAREVARDLRVLVIEDNQDSAASLKLLLSLTGHRVEVAFDGATGLALAREIRPDAILCDIGLPRGMSGYDVARAIRSDPALARVRLVALSGYGQEEDVRRAREAGFDQHLVKPAEYLALCAALVEPREAAG